MAEELTIKDWSADNVALTNFSPYHVVDIDTVNSGTIVTAAILATTSTEVIGVAYDQSKLNPDGSVASHSGIATRTWGIAKIVASAAIAAGQFVAVSDSFGDVAPATQTAGGSQPKPIVGRALRSVSASGDLCLVLLMVGARY